MTKAVRGAAKKLTALAMSSGRPCRSAATKAGHGTNRPYGIGRRVSHGCFRLYEPDIAELFRQVPVGTQVTVVYQPVKLGWDGNALMLEIHPSADQLAEIDLRGDFTPDEPVELPAVMAKVLGDELRRRIEWDTVAMAAWRRTGRPIRIDRPPSLLPPGQAG